MWVTFLGRPEPPGNLQILSLNPISVVWNRPANIPAEVPVNYTLTVNSTISEAISRSYWISNETQTSILDLIFLETGECAIVTVSLVASVAGTEDSAAAVVMDSFCKSVLLLHLS